MAYNMNSDAEMLQQLMVKQMLDNAQKKRDFATTIGLRSNPPVKGDIPESYSAGGVSFKTPEGIKQVENSLKAKNAIELDQFKAKGTIDLDNKLKELRQLPVYKILSENDKAKMEAMGTVSVQLKDVSELVDKLESGYGKGVFRKYRLKNDYLKDPDLQELGTAYGYLTSTLLKQFQGSRPSDFDMKIWEQITGKDAVTPENMKAALNYTKNFVEKDKQRTIPFWNEYYGIDKDKLRRLINAGVTPSAKKVSKNNEGSPSMNKISTTKTSTQQPNKIKVGGVEFEIQGE